MKKRGFTLIELLAVIVILGIIAVIAVPTINGVIKESRLGAFKASTLSLFHAYTNYEAENGFEVKDEINIFDLDITNKSTFLSGEIYRKEDSIKVETVSNGVFCASGTSNNLKIVEGTCDLLDETPPLIISVTAEVTTNSITLYTTYEEEESFISKHEYRIVKENEDIENATWMSGDSLTENLSTKTFSSLEQGVKYKIQVRLTNTALENNVSEIYELEVSTFVLGKPVITLLTSKEYATEKDVKITYPEGEGFTYEYSLDGENWISTNENEKTIVVEENTTIKARVSDGVNVIYADALTISGIDKTKPVVTIVKSNGNNQNILTSMIEPASTVSGYTYTWYKDGEVISGETSSTLTTTASGVYQLKVTTGAGVESVSNEITVSAYTITYNLNGGTGSIPNGTKIEDIPLNITTVTPTKEGYGFVGWGLTSTDKTPTYTSGSSYTKNESITLYAIFKKGYTITFVENGATLSKKTESCEVYNNETGCTITTPTITRSGYSIIGYGESVGSKTSVVGNNATITVNGNKTYYAITSKVLTANFHKNTVSSISATSSSCTIYNTETSCNITLPTITPQTNFMNNGWGTSAGQTSNGVTSITLNTSNTGSTWYALNSRALTWNFNKNTVSSISATSRSCTIWNESASCTITTPTITPQANFTQGGFGTATGSTSAAIAQNASMTLNNTTTGGTYYALNSRTLTWNFHKNTVSSISATSRSCTIWSTSGTCQVTTPTITPQANFTQQGFGTATGSTSAAVAQNASMTLSTSKTGGTYYALNSRTLTWNFNKNTVSSISATSRSCTIWSTSGTCQVTTPTITPQANFTQQGFGTATGSTSAAIAQNVSMTLNNTTTGGTYYALNSRTLTWNFNKNTVSSISATSRSCTIWNTSASCAITTPTITPQTNFTQGGFGTATGSTSATVAQNASMTLSNSKTGGTYYALNSRVLTWNFNKNTVSSISATSRSCTIWSTSGTCVITTPTITAQTNFTQGGFGTATGSTSATVAQNASMTLSTSKTGGTYYALNSRTLTWNFNKNTVSSISATSRSCTIWNESASCTITTPTITPQANFTQGGFGTATGSTSATVAQNASMTLSTSKTGGTYYALNSRRLTWNFNKGSVSSISKTTDGCTIWSTGATCTISAPTITPVSGYTGNGFGTASTATSATVAASGTITLSNTSNGGTYYGLQKKTVTITYNGNGATGGSTATQSCTMYNANTTCSIKLNSNGFTRTNYNFQGFGTGVTTVSHNAGTSYSFSSNTTLYAIWKSKITIESLIQNNPYSYYLYFKFKDNEEHLFLSNTKMGIMEHYSDDASKRKLSIPSYYRPDSTYTVGDHYKIVNGEWKKLKSNGNLNSYFTNVSGDNAKLENIDNWFDKFCYNYTMTLYKNNTTGTISIYTTRNGNNCLNGPTVDPDGNKRYAGANPNNYVSFNGELWRIIGTFSGKIKIIKATSIGNREWNSTNLNNWPNSSLYNYLNTTYYNGLNATYKAMVENAPWKIGGCSTTAKSVDAMYQCEKDTKASSASSTTAAGYIGLMSASDYGYASSGCSSGTQTLLNYNNATCTSTNWLKLGIPEYLINASSDNPRYAYLLDSNGQVYAGHTDGLTRAFAVRPTVYLKSTVKILSGTGSSSDPFILQ